MKQRRLTMNKPNLLKSDIYNAISAMELKCMDEIHGYDIEKDRIGYYTKLGELNTYTKLKHFIADYPIMIEQDGEENDNSINL